MLNFVSYFHLFSTLFISDIGCQKQLQCFHCSNVTHTYECLKSETCGSFDQICFIQTNYDSSPVTYSQGCMSKQLCGGGAGLIGRSLRDKRGEVEVSRCRSDYCNIYDSERTSGLSGLVFKISTHIGDVDVQEAWKTGKGAMPDEYCRNVHLFGCSHHYRHPVVDNWTHIRKDLIKYALYKNEVEVASVWFNGTGSSLTDWFSDSRIINSTWTDLHRGGTEEIQIERRGESWLTGRQFILLKRYNGCQQDYGWSVVISEKLDTCVYDKYSLKTPYILYSKLPTAGHYPTDPSYNHLGDFDLADAAAVYIYSNN